MTLKSTRIYGIMGTNFSGKMARPCQKIGRDTPPCTRPSPFKVCEKNFDEVYQIMTLHIERLEILMEYLESS